MSAQEAEQQPSSFEDVVNEGFARARQGAVLVVEARGFHPTRVRWLGQQLSQLVPGSAVHPAGDSLFLMLVRHAGPAETWLLVERLRRQLMKTGWDRVVVASGCWPVQGSSPMDVVAAALASLFDERFRVETELHTRDIFVDIDGGAFNWSSAGELLSG
ncbi:MAG: hypothetical protein Q8L48_19000 [Archangium sp.]|nr:hypothetical protein [Archangium sp.]